MAPMTLGILLMFVAGFISISRLVLSKTMQSVGLPYYNILSMSFALAFSVFALLAGLLKAPCPERKSLKWILMVGIAANGRFASLIVAVQLGAPTGDVAAVSSVNTVFAALLGRIVLGEPLQLSHIVSALCCMIGGVLIAKPVFLFGASSSSVPSTAYLMAVLSGFCAAVIAISARKAGDESPWFLNMCQSGLGCLVFAALPFTSLANEPDVVSVLQNNLDVATASILANFLMSVIGIGCTTLAGMLCPAAVTATVGVSSCITLGYMADVLIFGMNIDALSCCGAALMLSSVLVMACTRKPSGEGSSPVHLESAEAGQAAAKPTDDDETNSLASFIATEFVAESGYQGPPVRHRRPTVANLDSPASSAAGWERTLYGISVMTPSAISIR
eukprot:TRINITY_DN18979_c0_g1_i1.p1 TRINITY_DN18979_c0_g1~~TRINITY_DN18979_c0_g1_i1.p1  ORF type:complete len:389 (+),score=58.61 TRINITY_DN18979_c0_g1_i1:138-1304(+)